MKRQTGITIAAVLLLIFSTAVCSGQQSGKAEHKRQHNNMRVALGYPFSAKDWSADSPYPCFSVQYEGRFWRLGIGPILGVSAFKGYGNTYYTPVTGMLLLGGIRGNFYIIQAKHFDLYAGGMASVLVGDNIYTRVGNHAGKWGLYAPGDKRASEEMGFKPGWQVGCNVWLGKHVGFTGEVGQGTAVATLGITFRF